MKPEFMYGYAVIHPTWCVRIVAQEASPPILRECIFSIIVLLIFALYLAASSTVILIAGASVGDPEMCAYLLLINGWIAYEFASVQRLW